MPSDDIIANRAVRQGSIVPAIFFSPPTPDCFLSLFLLSFLSFALVIPLTNFTTRPLSPSRK